MNFGVSRFRRLLFVSCAGYASTNLVDLTDTAIAGHLVGERALDALNLFWPCIDFQFFVATTIACGSAILYADATGKLDVSRMRHLFSNGLLLALLAGFFAGFVLFFLQVPLFRYYGVTGEVASCLKAYWDVFIWEAVLFPLYVYLRTLVCADGDGKICTASFTMEVLANACASYVCCRFFGIAGCAMGSIISTLSATLVLLIHFARAGNSLHFKVSFSLRDSVRAIVAAFPDSCSTLFTAGATVLLNRMLITRFGTDALTVMAVVFAANGFALFLYGVGQAAQPFVGVYFAEGIYPAVKSVMRDALRWSLGLGALLAVFLLLFPNFPIWLVGVEMPQTIASATCALRVVALSYVFLAPAVLFSAYYLFVFKPARAMILVLLLNGLLPLVGSALGAQWGGETGFWVGYALAPVGALVIFLGVSRLLDGKELFPWCLDSLRDMRIKVHSIMITPESASSLAREIEETLRGIGASLKTCVRAPFLVEDSLMEIYDRNEKRSVMAEVTLDFTSAIRLIIRDAGRVSKAGGSTAVPSVGLEGDEAAFRDKMLKMVTQVLPGSHNVVAVGYNRVVFDLGKRA